MGKHCFLGSYKALILLIFTIASLMGAAPAQAGVCPLFDAGNFTLENCDDNARLSQAALDCTTAYYNHVQAAQADVLRKFQEQVKAQKDLQSDSYDRTQEGYKNARAQLQSLIEDGKKARASVDDLYLNFYFPEHYDEPKMTGMSPRDYLSSQACYSQPEQIMLKSQQMIDKIMADLAATEEAAFGKQNTSGTRSAKVQVLEKAKMLGQEKAATQQKIPGIPSGKSRKPSSTITGIKPKGHNDLPKK